MARRRLPYIPGELQFITSSVYRRMPVFNSERCCRYFVDALADVRKATGFLLIGWVIMPEHFHLLMKPRVAHTSRGLRCMRPIFHNIKSYPNVTDVEWRDAPAETLLWREPSSLPDPEHISADPPL